jgi:vacuolar protein sorting-associated protein 45
VADADDEGQSFPAHVPLDLRGLDVVAAVRSYLNTMLNAVPGMKVILLDEDTMGVLSLAFTQSEILEREVYLFERLDHPSREHMPHLKALCLLRPDEHNVGLLAQELSSPKYGEYHVYFTNVVARQSLQRLASADLRQLVRGVHEYFTDYFPLQPDCFSLRLGPSVATDSRGAHRLTERVCDGLAACILSLKRQPILRYQKSSERSNQVARELARRMQSERRLFSVQRREEPPVLLILDRRNDPVTPLLSQWTYQAMVHDLIGIDNHRVVLGERGESRPATAGVRKTAAAAAAAQESATTEVVLNPAHDPFFERNMYLNWGEIGMNVKAAMRRVQSVDAGHRNLSTLDDMKQFIERYPEFRKMKAEVSNHISVLEQLLKEVNRRHLLDVSPIEQQLACNHDHSTALKEVSQMLRNPSIADMERVKITLLYALRYESHPDNDLNRLKSLLVASGMPEAKIRLVDALLSYSSAQQRPDLFKDTSWIDVAKSKLRSTGLAGVENIYTQHTPLLMALLEDLLRGKLDASLYPSIAGGATRGRPTQVICFFVGGATYAEAQAVARLNRTHPTARVILGGTDFINSQQFLAQVEMSER